MSQKRAISTTKHPYERSSNLSTYVENVGYHQEKGWVNGKVYFRGRFFSPEEFNEMFPLTLKIKSSTIDGRVIDKD